MRNQIRSFALVAAAVVIAACGGDGATSTQEPEPEPELAFTAALPNGVAGNALTAIQVRVVDENGDVITTSTAPVTIAITAGTGADGATLTGVLTRNAVAGVATFDGLTIVKAGDDFKLTATSNDIPSATSGTFDIVHNTPDRLRVVTSPGLSMAGQPLAPAFVVRVEDAYGNIATNATNNVTVSLAGGSLSAQIGGTVTKAPLNGIVSFDNVTIDRSGAAYLVTASAPGLSNAPSAAFNVQISLRFVNELTNGLAGFETGNTVMIEAQDPIGTPLTARAVSMTATGGGAVFQIAPSPNTDPQGRAERIWILGTTAGNQTVTASVSGVSISKTINALARTSCGFSSSQAFHAFPPRDTLRFQPTTRTVRVAVLFIDFPDLAGTRTVAQMMSDIVNPAAAMLSGTTYGKLQLQLVATSGWMRMPESANDLRWTDGKMTHLDYINTVIARHDGVFDFSTIDVVWIFRSSRFDPQISSGTATFFKGSNVIPPRDGREMKSFVTFGSDVHLMNVYTYWPVYGRNVVAHEMGHVYGLPDLYAYQSAPGENGLRFSGGWSFMGWVAPATSWTAAERLYVGALTDNDLLCPPSEPFTAQVTMTQIAMTTGVRAIGLRSTATRMTFIESRIAVLQDANACQLGVLVYDVNGAETLGNGPIRVREIRPSAAGAQMDECGVKWNAPARSGDVFELGDPNVEVQILSIIAPTGEARIKITRR